MEPYPVVFLINERAEQVQVFARTASDIADCPEIFSGGPVIEFVWIALVISAGDAYMLLGDIYSPRGVCFGAAAVEGDELGLFEQVGEVDCALVGQFFVIYRDKAGVCALPAAA